MNVKELADKLGDPIHDLIMRALTDRRLPTSPRKIDWIMGHLPDPKPAAIYSKTIREGVTQQLGAERRREVRVRSNGTSMRVPRYIQPDGMYGAYVATIKATIADGRAHGEKLNANARSVTVRAKEFNAFVDAAEAVAQKRANGAALTFGELLSFEEGPA